MAQSGTKLRMIKWICGMKLTDKLFYVELRERLGMKDIDAAKEAEMVLLCIKKRQANAVRGTLAWLAAMHLACDLAADMHI